MHVFYYLDSKPIYLSYVYFFTISYLALAISPDMMQRESGHSLIKESKNNTVNRLLYKFKRVSGPIILTTIAGS